MNQRRDFIKAFSLFSLGVATGVPVFANSVNQSKTWSDFVSKMKGEAQFFSIDFPFIDKFTLAEGLRYETGKTVYFSQWDLYAQPLHTCSETGEVLISTVAFWQKDKFHCLNMAVIEDVLKSETPENIFPVKKASKSLSYTSPSGKEIRVKTLWTKDGGWKTQFN